MATDKKPRYKILDDDEIVTVPINVAPYGIVLFWGMNKGGNNDRASAKKY